MQPGLYLTTYAIRVVLFAICALTAIMIAGCRRDRGHSDQVSYTCPMHPSVVRDKPGACPVCHMELVRKVDAADVAFNEDLAQATESPNAVIESSIQTVRGKFDDQSIRISRTGIVTYDPRRSTSVVSRVAGRIERSYVKYAYQKVTQGEKVAEIYSPELVSTQRELLYLVSNDPGNTTIINAMRTKLITLGLSVAQIEQLLITKKPSYSIAIFSPATGIVIPRNTLAPAATASPATSSAPMSPADGMTAVSGDPSRGTRPATTDAVVIREGSYVTAGESLFSIVNTENLLIEINLPASEQAPVRKGDSLQVRNATTAVPVIVDMVQPFVSQGESLIKVRAYVSTKDNFTVGQRIEATLSPGAVKSLWIPRSAVVDLGLRKVAFIKQGSRFTPVVVQTGPETPDMVAIRSGIASGDDIAINAQFLVDGEGFLHP